MTPNHNDPGSNINSSSSALGSAVGAPDPGVMGPYDVTTQEYNLGNSSPELPGMILACTSTLRLYGLYTAGLPRTGGVDLHFIQEDRPDEVGRAIAGWLQRI